MAIHRFRVVLSDEIPPGNFAHFAERLFEAGCDDGTFGTSRGVSVVDFAREARSFPDAIRTAAADIREAGLTPESVEIEIAELAE